MKLEPGQVYETNMGELVQVTGTVQNPDFPEKDDIPLFYTASNGVLYCENGTPWTEDRDNPYAFKGNSGVQGEPLRFGGR